MITLPEHRDLLAMLFERGNAMQTFWGFYITLAGALLAFFGAAQRPRRIAYVLSGVFIAFATVNFLGMYDIAKQRDALYSMIPDRPEPQACEDRKHPQQGPRMELLCAARPPEPSGVAAFHLLADAAVLIAIWLLTLRARHEGDGIIRG